MLKIFLPFIFSLMAVSCSSDDAFRQFYASMYLNEGNRFFNNADYKNAIPFYDKAIRLDPVGETRFYCFYFRGYSHYYRGNYGAAVIDMDTAIRLSPKFEVLYMVRGNAKALNRLYDDALADFDRVLALNPESADAYFNKGNVYGSRGQYQKAIEEYSMALSVNVDMAPAYQRRGDMYLALGLPDNAIDDYTLAIRLNPQDRLSFAGRSRSYLQKGLVSSSREDHRVAKELAETESKRNWKSAQIALGKGEWEDALMLFSRSIELDPSGISGSGIRGETFYDRGVVYMSQDLYDKAVTDFLRAVELNNRNWKALTYLGASYFELDYLDKAEVYLNESISVNPRNDYAYYYLGRIRFLKNDLENSLAEFNRALSINSRSPAAITARAETLNAMGKYEEAINDYNSAFELGAADNSLNLLRGNNFYALGMFDDAIADFTEYIRNSRGTSAAQGFLNRGHTFFDMKKYALANRDYTSFLTFGTNGGFDDKTVEEVLTNMHKCYLYLVKRRAI